MALFLRSMSMNSEKKLNTEKVIIPYQHVFIQKKVSIKVLKGDVTLKVKYRIRTNFLKFYSQRINFRAKAILTHFNRLNFLLNQLKFSNRIFHYLGKI